MGATLMATTSILLCSGLAAVISSTYSVKKPLNDAIYGAHGEFMDNLGIVSQEYVSELLEKGFALNTVGNRLFYVALPLLLWVFGPVLVFLCFVTMVPMFYNLDFVLSKSKDKMDPCESGNGTEFVSV
ncbi:hypothetical protein RND71_004944 [Anisodus tanguticus]|uniref:Uncharacterized protein n=1 Tax=Anisodus tanguticus TaxID=243964 RepID=A0AAE1SRW2_9SOLA|nr:hypothetical protein RND71_004944 [Anisodus tanguticus]